MTDTTAGEQANPPQIRILTQYTKDLSFENPSGARSLDPNAGQPNLEVAVNVQATRTAAEDQFEVELKINAAAKQQDANTFICELSYGGIFELTNIPRESLQLVLLIECPRLLFPFARRIIADVTRDGGYPPLLIDPIDFAGLYRQQMQQQQQNQPQAS